MKERTRAGILWRIARPIVLAVLFVFVFLQRQAIADWAVLQRYQPSAAITQLASQTTMTPLGKHWFYINRPQLNNKTDFNKHCGSLQSSGEQSVVLGCFAGNRQGIYLYDVTDPRLSGVVQVTAAHEMLHQAYARLSPAQRTKVNAMLTSYAAHGLTDQTVKDQIAIYKKSEPKDVVDEMHSLFGTEIANLPAPLEQYYAQYFTDRSKIVAYNTQYQAVFTAQTQQIATYDAQLATLKKTIDAEQADLTSQSKILETQRAQLTGYDQSSEAYAAAASKYNAQVDAYNAQLAIAQKDIDQYNQIVSTRNDIASQEQQLQSSLSSQLTPVGQ